MHTTRKNFRLLFLLPLSLLLCLILSSCVFAQGAPNLPDVPGWICGELRTTNLDTVSGNQGVWSQRDYRAASGLPIRATLMTGKGPKMLRFPPMKVDANDGPLGSGCTYRTLEIGGHAAIVETHPVLGVSVVVSLDGGYLTLESGDYGVTAEDATAAASSLLAAM